MSPSPSSPTDAVHAQADALVAEVGGGAVLVDARTPDGVSARVTVAGTWHPPVLQLLRAGRRRHRGDGDESHRAALTVTAGAGRTEERTPRTRPRRQGPERR